MDSHNLFLAYGDAFGENPPMMISYSMPNETLAALMQKALKRGSPVTMEEMAAASGCKPPEPFSPDVFY
jgi:hypothetical protein